MKKRLSLLSLALVLLFLIPPALGIGLRPGVIRMNLIPGYERTFDFYVTNTNNIPLNARIMPFYEGGRLEGSLTISEDTIPLEPFEMKKFYVTLKIPEDVVAPGVSRIGISAYEERNEKSKGGINLQAGVATMITIRGLHPGKYIEASVSAQAGGEGDPVGLVANIQNLGTETVLKATTKFEVYDVLTNQLVAMLDSDTVENVASWLGASMKAEMEGSKAKKGQYKVTATIFYDGLSMQKEAFFRIGEYGFEIVSFTQEGTLGKVIPFEITVESKWNQPFENIYAEVFLKQGTEVMKSFKTPTETLKPFERKTLTGYLDATGGLSMGVYTIEVRVYFTGGVVATNGEFKLFDAEGRLKAEERTGGFRIGERPKKPFFTAMNILIMIIFILVVSNIIWFLYARKKRYEYV